MTTPGEPYKLGGEAHALGAHGTTPIWVYERLEKERTEGLTHGQMRRPLYVARMGISIFGHTNMSERDYERCLHNPFHDLFMDNFAQGEGYTLTEALEKMEQDLTSISDSLFGEPTHTLL